MRAVLTAAVIAAILCFVAPTVRAETVDVALVFAADVSRSIDDDEFKLQRQGYAAAVTNPRVLQAIAAGQHGAVAICFVEWSGPEEQQVVVDWTVVRDGETAAQFAAILLNAPRSFVGRTSISAALDFSRAYFDKSGVAAERRVIDVSGDGTNNSGRTVTEARDEAVAEGIVINGLAIINNHPTNAWTLLHVQPPEGLPEWYRLNVIGGPASFHIVVEGFETFADAITRKLVAEIASNAPPARRRLASLHQ